MKEQIWLGSTYLGTWDLPAHLLDARGEPELGRFNMEALRLAHFEEFGDDPAQHFERLLLAAGATRVEPDAVLWWGGHEPPFLTQHRLDLALKDCPVGEERSAFTLRKLLELPHSGCFRLRESLGERMDKILAGSGVTYGDAVTLEHCTGVSAWWWEALNGTKETAEVKEEKETQNG